ncbi:hypothetical protein BJ138DRAFT_1105325 [Hygrophoropsis aurantiaca]|uniref:Uncharacterized protein n=1 Tax=Hygrophoropsis aurantiaca TaxID=72124 RepID=A0ACB8A0T2_9AGAM|nr:hypothetical protein BJ138DRAFT_1105325 [Hygrophoropsis aurantiaca]
MHKRTRVSRQDQEPEIQINAKAPSELNRSGRPRRAGEVYLFMWCGRFVGGVVGEVASLIGVLPVDLTSLATGRVLKDEDPLSAYLVQDPSGTRHPHDQARRHCCSINTNLGLTINTIPLLQRPANDANRAKPLRLAHRTDLAPQHRLNLHLSVDYSTFPGTIDSDPVIISPAPHGVTH